jgi:hypothetical protein
MGGINCPPPSYAGDDLPRIRGEYIRELAHYCKSLFGGVSKFFAANAKIEVAILDGDDISGALTLLKQSKADFIEAQSYLGTVGALISTMAPNDNINIAVQVEYLGSIMEKIDTCYMDLDVLSSRVSLQESIWAHEDITHNLVGAVEEIVGALTWQNEFATTRTLVTG